MSHLTPGALGALSEIRGMGMLGKARPAGMSGLGDIDWDQWLNIGGQIVNIATPIVLPALGIGQKPPTTTTGGTTPGGYVPVPGQPVVVQTPSGPPASSTPSWLPWAFGALALALLAGGRR